MKNIRIANHFSVCRFVAALEKAEKVYKPIVVFGCPVSTAAEEEIWQVFDTK